MLLALLNIKGHWDRRVSFIFRMENVSRVHGLRWGV